mgnify:FL=1
MEDESGAVLDLGLPCWDSGRRDRRRIHDSRDELESRAFSTVAFGVGSLDRRKKGLIHSDLDEESCAAVAGRGIFAELVASGERGPGPMSLSCKGE